MTQIALVHHLLSEIRISFLYTWYVHKDGVSESHKYIKRFK